MSEDDGQEPVKVTADQQFAIVPKWLILSDVSPQALRVYAVLALHAGRDHTAWPSLRRIGEQARASVRTVRRALDDLEGIGAISVRRSPWNGPGGPPRDVNHYVIHTIPGGLPPVDKGVALAPQVGRGWHRGVAPVAPRTRSIELEGRARAEPVDNSADGEPLEGSTFRAQGPPPAFEPSEPPPPEVMQTNAARAAALREQAFPERSKPVDRTPPQRPEPTTQEPNP